MSKFKSLLTLGIACLLSCVQVSAQKIIVTIAGTGNPGFSGDSSQAIAAQFNFPSSVAVDRAGNIYVADLLNNRVRKINTAGIITTIAGNGVAGYSGDGGPATSAQLNHPYRIAIDTIGNVYVVDYNNRRLRKITPAGIISTIAGTGVAGYSGDGNLAVAAQLQPSGVAVDVAGNIYISDGNNHRIRKINSAGIISTVAGTGIAGNTGDGGQATAAQLGELRGIAVDKFGSVYFLDSNRVRKINSNGVISTVAGMPGASGYSGDGGPATAAMLSYPSGIAIDASLNLYIADNENGRIRKVDNAGIITTIAGVGGYSFGGDGGLAVAAQFNHPADVSLDTAGNLFVTDIDNKRIRAIVNKPALNITVPQSNICANTATTFTATPKYGGQAPVYQWQVNGVNVAGANSDHYTTTTLVDRDTVTCTMISNYLNAVFPMVTSDTIIMTVNPPVTPIINITASQNPVNAGTSVTFTLVDTNAGTAPAYQWMVNGANVGSSANYSYMPANNDIVTCTLTSSVLCASPVTVKSDSIVMKVVLPTNVNAVNTSRSSAELFPNPNDGSFTVKGMVADKAQQTLLVEVLNAIGQRVYQKEFPMINGIYEQRIELAHSLPAGNYFLKINDGINKVFRFAIEK